MSPAARVLLAVVRAYRWGVSPLLGPRCRFAPSCSAYAAEALQLHGAARGSWLAVRRLLRCHPFHPGGHDPVPQAATRAADRSAAPSRQRPGTAPSSPLVSPRRPPDLPPGRGVGDDGLAQAPARRPVHRTAPRPGPGG